MPGMTPTTRRIVQAVLYEAIAVAFVLRHPSRPVAIVGTQNPDHLTAVKEAIDVRLDRSDVYRIIEASTGERLP